MSKMEMVACVAVQRVNDAMPGDATEVPAEAYDELVRQGVVRAPGSELPPQSSPAEHQDRDLVDLIEEIPQDDEYWTSGGKPTTEAFQTLFGRDVSAAERDAAWEAFESGQ